jgi:hypothetical protein
MFANTEIVFQEEILKVKDIIIQLDDSREFLVNKGYFDEALEASDQKSRLNENLNFEIKKLI